MEKKRGPVIRHQTTVLGGAQQGYMSERIKLIILAERRAIKARQSQVTLPNLGEIHQALAQGGQQQQQELATDYFKFWDTVGQLKSIQATEQVLIEPCLMES